ncbi:family 43 glycosylhydrolase [Thermophagus sp. OGC60D27]|uniref:family 43 glycosylhydrolase n=1 Tax=Thermophagus sp. OGC60D27 TaxID=3458415 RepID=UPI0040377FAF
MKTIHILIFLLTIMSLSTFAQRANVHGDFPDPSIIKYGDYYYCISTSSNWAPGFPILKSKDLKNWEWVSNVFPEKPDWINNSYWAPEISTENGKVYVYYTARKKGAGLCVAVASADKPEGPYKDHGPLVCEPLVGSIDGFAIRDKNNKLYLTWKTDGNSKNQPTPIWAQEMNEERTELLGEPVELFRNDLEWEGRLIEGQAIVKHGDYYYCFYSANGCCGRRCSYKTGVARAKELLGPWEKDPDNPILGDEENWKCQGHGTPIVVDDKNYLLYHGYNEETGVFTGRQGILREYAITDDNWIAFLPNYIESDLGTKNANGTLVYFEDDFSGAEIKPSWQWSVYNKPNFKMGKNTLVVSGANNQKPVFMGQRIYSKNYQATLSIGKKSTAATGISLIGDENKNISLVLDNDSLWIEYKNRKEEETINKMALPQEYEKLELSVLVENNSKATFLYRIDGDVFVPVNEEPIDFAFLPPWDRAVRVGLYCEGREKDRAVFNHFILSEINE